MLSRLSFDAVIETVLFETEAPEIVLVRDHFDGTYLCALVQTERDNYFYMGVPVSSARLSDLRTGKMDLREALAEPEEKLYFTGRLKLDASTPTITLKAEDGLDLDWLPESGFLLSDFKPSSDEAVVTEAMRRNSAVVSCSLDPPEARGTVSRINADRLAEWLNRIQTFVRHATDRATKNWSDSKKGQFQGDPWTLQVFGFAPGSFTVHMAAEEGADLLGLTPVGAGLEKVDELMGLLSMAPDSAFAKLTQNSGVVLGAFQNLLEFVAEQDLPVTYRWAEPAKGISRGHRVTPECARSMVAVLATKKALTRESIDFVGRFTAVNTNKAPFTWWAIDEDGRSRHGKVLNGSDGALSGVTIRSVFYQFACEQQLEKPVAGRAATTLYLKSATPLS